MEARGGEEAHREPNGGGRDVREVFEAWVDDGDDWREKPRHGCMESEQIKAKSKNWRYLRLYEFMGEL